MRDDFQKILYGVLIGFVVVLVVWIGYVYVAACGFSLGCERAAAVERTPIPTLPAATLPAPKPAEGQANLTKCRVAAANLIGAWVSAGYPETEPFPFTDADGVACQGTFAEDVAPLFVEANLWYPGAIACSTCHGSNLEAASAQLDLSTYSGIVAGSRRASESAQGTDILGGGVWEDSILYRMLVVDKTMPFGRPPDSPPEGPVIPAGTPQE
ncbi:MAG: hypothetical protein D6770_02105 [Anaerolineae bacterium]|nr:MAG: hypothetical protein D6770_02105 [Anaerolineae bacterium]